MGKKSGPPAPDYTAAAKEQGAQSMALTEAQTAANRPNVQTPWGNQTWTQDGDKWTQTTTLSPSEQQALDSQMAIQQGRSSAAQGLLGQATHNFETPMDWGSLPDRSGNISGPQFGANPSLDPNTANGTFDKGAFSFGGQIQQGLNKSPTDYRQTAQDAIWDLQKPALAQQREGLEVQLANQGLSRGSEAWGREMNRQDDSDARARLMAISEGRNESNQMFGQDLQSGQFSNQAQIQGFNQADQNANRDYSQNQGQAQFENVAQQQEFQNLIQAAQLGDSRAIQQLQAQIAAGGFNNTNRQGAITEGVMQRGQTLNELNALLTGQQVNMPSMPGFNSAGKAETPDLLGAANSQYGASLDQYNAKMGGIGNLAGLLGSAFSFSDARLKEDIRYTGDSIGGVPVVHYRYRGLPGLRIGVIAQDVLRIRPSAVAMHASGYLMVDYSELRA